MTTSEIVEVENSEQQSERERWRQAVNAFVAEQRSDNTAQAYKRGVEKYLLYLDGLAQSGSRGLTVENVGTPVIAMFYKSLNASVATKNATLVAVTAFYSFLAREGVVRGNPAREVKRGRMSSTHSDTEFLTREEGKRLVIAAKADSTLSYALVSMFLGTGLRVSEVVALKESDFKRRDDSDGSPVVVARVKQKGGKHREVLIPHSVVVALREHMNQYDFMAGNAVDRVGAESMKYIFAKKSDPNQHISREHCAMVIKRLAKAANINKKISPHSLRHSAASEAIRQGKAKEQIQEFLGHSSIAITERYIHRSKGYSNSPANSVANAFGI